MLANNESSYAHNNLAIPPVPAKHLRLYSPQFHLRNIVSVGLR